METPIRKQRLSVRALVRRGDRILLARIAPSGYGTAGTWTLPGGGVDHGEHPEESLRREMYEETGLLVRPEGLIEVFSRHFTGRAPSGVLEDHHGVHLIYSVTISSDNGEPRVVETDGTTDMVRWVAGDEIEAQLLPVSEVVRHALTLRRLD
ncbi:MAG: NUDIX hydrolase [Nocardioidaceae bacterium]